MLTSLNHSFVAVHIALDQICFAKKTKKQMKHTVHTESDICMTAWHSVTDKITILK